MLELKIEKSFKKDIERDFELLKTIISLLQNHITLEARHKRHPLQGNLKYFESVHIKNDWLLIFKIDKQYLNLVMLGKHTQVYKKFK